MAPSRRSGILFSIVPLLLLLLLFLRTPTAFAVDFLFNSFKATNLTLVHDARVEADSGAVRLTNDSVQHSYGRAFYQYPLTMINATRIISSFSTSFVFSVLPDNPSTPGFGLAFVLSNSTSPPGALSGQYFGLFSSATTRLPGPLLAVKFDMGRNPEFRDPDGNHVGINLNYVESSFTRPAGYYLDTGLFVPLDMRNGQNVRAWIEFDGPALQISVTIAPANMTQQPTRPLIKYTDPDIASYLSPKMFVGFSASKVRWVEPQRILAWSLSDTGRPAKDINTSGLPVFLPPTPPPRTPASFSPSASLVAGLVCSAMVLFIFCFLLAYKHVYVSGRGRKKARIMDGSEDSSSSEDLDGWETEYWPRRFAYEDLWRATEGFSKDHLLGHGGFGKVYKGVLLLKPGEVATREVAVKCVSHDSKQGLREFMAEISSMGRLQHKSLVHMRGWCRRGRQLMLVYDYMPNGSLDRWIFPPSTLDDGPMGWEGRRRVLVDVAEGLLYLHEGWEKVVLHRDIKPSNILLDGGMRARLGDFGLARLYSHGDLPATTRVVGTLGYMAPELGTVARPAAASDVYSYGVVVLVVCCRRRAVEIGKSVDEDDFVLVEWVRGMFAEGKVAEALDRRLVVGDSDGVVEEMERVTKLGLACCHPDPERRPTMREVVEVMSGTRRQVNE